MFRSVIALDCEIGGYLLKFVLFYLILACPGFLASGVEAKDLPLCSTERVNPNCTVVIDRYSPVTLPTVQMRHGAVVTVKVARPLSFETLSLDLQSTQAVTGADPTQTIGTAVLGQAKGVVFSQQDVTHRLEDPSLNLLGLVKSDADSFNELKKEMISVARGIEIYLEDSTYIYTELQEIVGILSPEALTKGKRLKTSPLYKSPTPIPWKDYSAWREWMLCELGPACKLEIKPGLADQLGKAATLATKLAACSNGAEDTNTISIDCQIKKLKKPSNPDANRPEYQNALRALDEIYATLVAQNTALTSVTKDLGMYFVNINQWTGSEVGGNAASSAIPLLKAVNNEPQEVGSIEDPAKQAVNRASVVNLLGRQVVYSVSAVNQISTFVASIPSTAQKKSIATVSILYADPIVEASAGAFFSTLPNRSFANQTLVTQKAGSAPSAGNIVIAETITRPTIVPFAAANWRVGHDFLVGRRRSAFYLTAAVGINAYNTTAEFAAGPSFSWRALVFSALYHAGHDVRLTQGEQVGQAWCNSTAATGSIPKCSGSPPGPSTERYWTGAFAIGIAVRVPVAFSSAGH